MNFDLSVESPEQKIAVYLPAEEAELIKVMYLMCIENLRLIVYREHLDLIVNAYKFASDRVVSDWRAHTQSAYYHKIVTDWCRLFGIGNKLLTYFASVKNQCAL